MHLLSRISPPLPSPPKKKLIRISQLSVTIKVRRCIPPPVPHFLIQNYSDTVHDTVNPARPFHSPHPPSFAYANFQWKSSPTARWRWNQSTDFDDFLDIFFCFSCPFPTCTSEEESIGSPNMVRRLIEATVEFKRFPSFFFYLGQVPLARNVWEREVYSFRPLSSSPNFHPSLLFDPFASRRAASFFVSSTISSAVNRWRWWSASFA